MSAQRTAVMAWVCLLLLTNPSVGGEAGRKGADAPSQERTVRFEANEGQASRQVRFIVRGPEGAVLLTPGEVVVTGLAQRKDGSVRRAGVFRLQFEGANSAVEMAGGSRLKGRTNYYRGGQRDRWLTGVPSFRTVTYNNLYRGVDLEFTGRDNSLSFEMRIAPGADPGAVRFRLTPSHDLEIDRAGLMARSSLGEFRLGAPRAYQTVKQRQVPVAVAFRVLKDGSVGLELGEYDRGLPLTIDPPVIAFPLGPAHEGAGFAAEVDARGDGEVFIVGTAISPDYPEPGVDEFTPGSDIIVIRLDLPAGEVPSPASWAYTTYLSGCNSSLGSICPSSAEYEDTGYDIVAPQGTSIYVTGTTSSDAFPILGGYRVQPYSATGASAVLARLDAVTGELLASTYVASGQPGWVDPYPGFQHPIRHWGPSIDYNAGAVYVAGGTYGGFWLSEPHLDHGGGPLTGGQRGYVAKISSDLSTREFLALMGWRLSAIAVTEDRIHAVGTVQNQVNTDGDGMRYELDLSGELLLQDGLPIIPLCVAARAEGDWPSLDVLLVGGFIDLSAAGLGQVAARWEPGDEAKSYIGVPHNPDNGSAFTDCAVRPLPFQEGLEPDFAAFVGHTGTPGLDLTGQTSLSGNFDALLAVTETDSHPDDLNLGYLGGSDKDRGSGVAIDQRGYTYVVGRTWSGDFPQYMPVDNPALGAPIANYFVAKFAGHGIPFGVRLETEKTLTRGVVQPGEAFDFIMRAKHVGLVSGGGVTLRDTFNHGGNFDLVSASVTPSEVETSSTGEFSWEWSLMPWFYPGQEVEARVRLRAKETAEAGSYCNELVVEAELDDESPHTPEPACVEVKVPEEEPDQEEICPTGDPDPQLTVDWGGAEQVVPESEASVTFTAEVTNLLCAESSLQDPRLIWTCEGGADARAAGSIDDEGMLVESPQDGTAMPPYCRVSNDPMAACTLGDLSEGKSASAWVEVDLSKGGSQRCCATLIWQPNSQTVKCVDIVVGDAGEDVDIKVSLEGHRPAPNGFERHEGFSFLAIKADSDPFIPVSDVEISVTYQTAPTVEGHPLVMIPDAECSAPERVSHQRSAQGPWLTTFTAECRVYDLQLMNGGVLSPRWWVPHRGTISVYARQYSDRTPQNNERTWPSD